MARLEPQTSVVLCKISAEQLYERSHASKHTYTVHRKIKWSKIPSINWSLQVEVKLRSFMTRRKISDLIKQPSLVRPKYSEKSCLKSGLVWISGTHCTVWICQTDLSSFCMNEMSLVIVHCFLKLRQKV